ncbi:MULTISPECIES: hypothetical protein [Bacillaceae]|uniref:hypothetical protein n=2 Tax=Bacillales TaxID=1385 RepID=UPI0004E1C088|nr:MULTISPECIES: hypothetical protein [Bacillaceae]MCF2647228.1 hypothetical protein [Niallia circulans]CAI9393041.1 hypothetical protein BACSP_03406 [Bacillus sp. T2.9-1]
MDLLKEIQLLDESSSLNEVLTIVEIDFKKLARIENKKFNEILENVENTELRYDEKGNSIFNWFNWRKVNTIIEESGGPDAWKEYFSPDNCWSCQNLSNIYNCLGWGVKPYSDTINSFITIYSFALLIYYPDDFYFDDRINSVRVLENGIRKKQIVSEKYLLSLSNQNNNYRFEDFDEVNNLKPIQLLAQLTHSFGNFMPCPDPPYNKIKGISSDIKDFLDLMLNKIINNKRIMGVTVSEEKYWKEWFEDKNENLLIDEKDYQLINDVKSFDGMHKEEFRQLLNKIIARIRIRGLKIVGKINMCKDVQKKCEELIKRERKILY